MNHNSSIVGNAKLKGDLQQFEESTQHYGPESVGRVRLPPLKDVGAALQRVDLARRVPTHPEIAREYVTALRF